MKATTISGNSGTHRVSQALFGLGIGLAAVALALFHLQLLVDRIANLANLQLDIALRWILTAVVLGSIAKLRRNGISVVWGRPALVLWILVLLIHIQVPLGSVPAAADGGKGVPTDELLLILPVSLSLAVVGRVLYRSRPKSSLSNRSGLQLCRTAGLSIFQSSHLRAGFLSSLSPRAPPA